MVNKRTFWLSRESVGSTSGVWTPEKKCCRLRGEVLISKLAKLNDDTLSSVYVTGMPSQGKKAFSSGRAIEV